MSSPLAPDRVRPRPEPRHHGAEGRRSTVSEQQRVRQPTGTVRSQRVAGRGDVPALPRRPVGGRPVVARLLRRLSARRHRRARPRRGRSADIRPDRQRRSRRTAPSRRDGRRRPRPPRPPGTAAPVAGQPAAGEPPRSRIEGGASGRGRRGGHATPLRGAASAVVKNMQASLECRPRRVCGRCRPSCWPTTAW